MPSQNETNALNMEMVKEASESISKQKDVKIVIEFNGEIHETHLTIDTVFTDSKIAQCIGEYLSQIDYAKKLGIPEDDSLYECYMIFMIIKHFTELEFPKDFEGQVASIRQLLDTKILFQIFSKFDPNEITRVSSELLEALENYNSNVDLLKRKLMEIGYEDPLGEWNFDDMEETENEEVKQVNPEE